jgi:hypothetical protein
VLQKAKGEWKKKSVTGRSFHLSAQDDQLLAKERIFCDQFGLATGLVDQHPRNE